MHNRLFDTEPMILHASGPLELSPLWGELERGLFATPPEASGAQRRDFTFFIWNSGAVVSHDRAKRLGTAERCLDRLGVPYGVLGRGIDPWKNVFKIQTLLDGLATVTTPYVIACDSPDVLILDDPGGCIERFESFGADLVSIADCSFWPPELQDLRWHEEHRPGAWGERFPYLNSGAFIGRTDFCREIFTVAARMADHQLAYPYVEGTSGAGTDADDQSIMKRLYIEHHPRLQLDFRCRIFQTLTYQGKDVLRVRKDAGGVSRWRQH